MIESDYKVILEDMPTTIGGMVKETDGFYTIVLNARMTSERNRESFADEADHISTGALNSERAADRIELESHRRRK